MKNKHTGVYDEADTERRNRAYFRSDSNDGGVPRCSKGKYDLPAECLKAVNQLSNGRHANADNPDAVLEVVNKPRQCEAWMEYYPNYTPKDHDEMIWRQAAHDLQSKMAEIQTKMAEFQSRYFDWKEVQAEKDSKFSQRIQALEETRHQETRSDSARFTNRQVYAVLASAVISAIAAVVAAVIALSAK